MEKTAAEKAMATRKAKRKAATIIGIDNGEIRGNEEDWSLRIGNDVKYFSTLAGVGRYLFERKIRFSGARTFEELLRQVKDARADIGSLFGMESE